MRELAFANWLASARSRVSPLTRGALFYSFFWGYTGVIEPFLNVYFKRLGISGTQIGAINALLPVMTLIVTPVVSSLADQKARRIGLLGLCCCGLSAAYLLLGLPRTFAGVFLCSLLLAFFRSPMPALADALAVRLGLRHRVDYGKMRLWGSLCFAVVAIAMGYVWARADMHRMFAIAAVCLLVVAVSTLLMEEDAPVSRRARSPWRLLLHDRGLLALFAATVLMGAALKIAFTFGPVYIQHTGGGESMVGMLMGLSAASETPMMFVGETLMRRFGNLRALLLSYGLLVAGWVGSLLAAVPWVLVAMGVVKGVGFGLFFIATVVMFDRRAPDNWSASVQGMVNAGAFGLAPIVSSFAGGLIYDAWPAGIYAASAGLALLAAGVLGLAAWIQRGENGLDHY